MEFIIVKCSYVSCLYMYYCIGQIERYITNALTHTYLHAFVVVLVVIEVY